MKTLFERLPEDIRLKMLQNQSKAHGHIDASVFKENILASKAQGGFDWIDTEEGHSFWSDVLTRKMHHVFFERYPKDSIPDTEVFVDVDKVFIKDGILGGYGQVGEVLTDNVNHPSHYKQFSVETIDMMERIWGAHNLKTYCEINAFKYKMRAGTKKGQSAEQDLAKAQWYLNKADKLMKKIIEQEPKQQKA